MKSLSPLYLLSMLPLTATPHFVGQTPANAVPPPPGAGVAALPEGVLADFAVDQTWAGHPVSYALVTERDHQFVAYYDADRQITVAGRRLGEAEWTRHHPAGVYLPGRNRFSNVTEWDSHNYLALALDKDGYLHLSGNLHNDPLIYYRSSRPFDVTSLERLDRMTGEREHNTTYPVFFKTSVGDLLFRYRDGSSGNGADIYNRYDTATRTWRNILSTPLLDGQGQRNAYAMNPVLGPDGHFHLLWMWRDTPDAATNHTLSYARSIDFVNWEKSDGTPLPLPITFATAEVVDPVPPRQGMINMTFNLGFDARNRPVAVYHRYDEAGKSQVYAARPAPDSPRWLITQISDWDFRWAFGGGGSLTADVILGPPSLRADGMLLVDFVTAHTARVAGSGRWQLDAETLRSLATLPPPTPVLPPSLAIPISSTPGLEVNTVVSRDRGRRWVLRWETLPHNRDRPRAEVPPPSVLRLYELPDADTSTAFRIGS